MDDGYDEFDDSVMVMALGDPRQDPEPGTAGTGGGGGDEDYGQPENARGTCTVCGKPVYRDVNDPMDLLHVDAQDSGSQHEAEVEFYRAPVVTVFLHPDGRVTTRTPSGIKTAVIAHRDSTEGGAGDYDWSAEPDGVPCEVSLAVDLSDVTDPTEAARRLLRTVRHARADGTELYVDVTPVDGPTTTVHLTAEEQT